MPNTKNDPNQWIFYIIGIEYKGVANARLFAGVTNDLTQRIKDHNHKGKLSLTKEADRITMRRLKDVRVFKGANLLWHVPCKDKKTAEHALEKFGTLEANHKKEILTGNFSSYSHYFKQLQSNA